ncbi:MAG: nucleotidyltransferase family protein [Amphiplicatus sp.]
MERDRILERLRKHEPELRSAGVAALSVFGSVARGEDRADSDLDLVVRLARRAEGLAWFRQMEALQRRLEAIAGRPVDLVAEPVRRPRLLHAIERDRLVAFQ